MYLKFTKSKLMEKHNFFFLTSEICSTQSVCRAKTDLVQLGRTDPA